MRQSLSEYRSTDCHPPEPATRNWPAAALLLLASTEYGAQIFPPLWGILALLPPAAGALAVVLLRRRRAG